MTAPAVTLPGRAELERRIVQAWEQHGRTPGPELAAMALDELTVQLAAPAAQFEAAAEWFAVATDDEDALEAAAQALTHATAILNITLGITA
jgi:hypothetical protein